MAASATAAGTTPRTNPAGTASKRTTPGTPNRSFRTSGGTPTTSSAYDQCGARAIPAPERSAAHQPDIAQPAIDSERGDPVALSVQRLAPRWSEAPARAFARHERHVARGERREVSRELDVADAV